MTIPVCQSTLRKDHHHEAELDTNENILDTSIFTVFLLVTNASILCCSVPETDKNNSILTTYWPNPYIVTGNRWYIDNQIWHGPHWKHLWAIVSARHHKDYNHIHLSMVQYKRILHLTIDRGLQTEYENVQRSCAAHNDDKRHMRNPCG